MISPTIGRRVWYWPSINDRSSPASINGMKINSDEQPCDAGVSYVWNDRLINVSVSDHNGIMHQRTSVPLLQDDDVREPGRACCQWMPYQAAQAKKNETESEKGDSK